MHFDPLCWEFLKFWRSWRSLNSKMGKWRKWELNAVHEEKNSLVKKKKACSRFNIFLHASKFSNKFMTITYWLILFVPIQHYCWLATFWALSFCLSVCLCVSLWLNFIYIFSATEYSLSDICLRVGEVLPQIKFKEFLPKYSCLTLSPANFWFGKKEM